MKRRQYSPTSVPTNLHDHSSPHNHLLLQILCNSRIFFKEICSEVTETGKGRVIYLENEVVTIGEEKQVNKSPLSHHPGVQKSHPFHHYNQQKGHKKTNAIFLIKHQLVKRHTRSRITLLQAHHASYTKWYSSETKPWCTIQKSWYHLLLHFQWILTKYWLLPRWDWIIRRSGVPIDSISWVSQSKI